jgi:hypothetical protein
MCGTCFFRIDSSNHLCSVVKGLLSLESSLSDDRPTWLPVIPWQITLVCLLTQTLGAVEKQDLSSLVIMKISNYYNSILLININNLNHKINKILFPHSTNTVSFINPACYNNQNTSTQHRTSIYVIKLFEIHHLLYALLKRQLWW